MHTFTHALAIFGAGVLTGGTLSYLYAKTAIARYDRALAAARSAASDAMNAVQAAKKAL